MYYLKYHRKTGIENSTWSYKKLKKKKKILIRIEDFKMHHSAG